MDERETDRAMGRLSQLAQRVIELARRLKADSVGIPRSRNDAGDSLPALPAVASGDDLA